MKKITWIILFCLFSVCVYAQPFPTLKSYVVNGIAIGDGVTLQELLKKFGKPSRSKVIRNECTETDYTYYYYSGMTLVDRGVGINIDEIFFNNPKNQLQLSTMTIDASTTENSIRKLGRVYKTDTKGQINYRLEDAELSAWVFDFKAGHLYRASFISNDC